MKDDNLRVYAVWLPMLMTDFERTVPGATKLLPDKRVSHYWDGEKKLGDYLCRIAITCADSAFNVEKRLFVESWFN